MSDNVLSLVSPCQAETEIKKSRFICQLLPCTNKAEVKQHLSSIRTKYPDANHHCWAYQIGPPGAMLQACSDDGEPHGTAGRPMLNVLTHAGLTNTLAVVSRFFGGTKLGTGGLVRAYAQAVNQALSTAQTDTYIDWSTLVITLDYANENQVRHLLSDYKFSIEQVSHEATVQIIGRADRNQVATMRADLGRLVLTFEGLE